MCTWLLRDLPTPTPATSPPGKSTRCSLDPVQYTLHSIYYITWLQLLNRLFLEASALKAGVLKGTGGSVAAVRVCWDHYFAQRR